MQFTDINTNFFQSSLSPVPCDEGPPESLLRLKRGSRVSPTTLPPIIKSSVATTPSYRDFENCIPSLLLSQEPDNWDYRVSIYLSNSKGTARNVIIQWGSEWRIVRFSNG